MAKAGRPRKYQHFDEAKRKKFFRSLERSGNVTASAAHAGVSSSCVYRHMSSDPEFAEKVEQSKAKALAEVEAEIYRRGVEGYDDPVYYQGGLVGYQRKYDSNLLIHMARVLDPSRHAQKQQLEVNHQGKVEVEAKDKLADLIGYTVDENEKLENGDDPSVEDAEFED